VLKECPKITNFGQFPLSFCQKVTKKLQNARKIVNLRKSLCHHLNPLSNKHLTPFFSESPISPRVHSDPPNPHFQPKNKPPSKKIQNFSPISVTESHFQPKDALQFFVLPAQVENRRKKSGRVLSLSPSPPSIREPVTGPAE
jgi:hypothetical protein